jgi:periplasmic protein TonB
MTSVPLTVEHMAEIPEPRANPNAQFLAGDVPHSSEKNRLGGGFAASAMTHVGGFFLLLYIFTIMPPAPPTNEPLDRIPSDIIWLNAPGPGGGGGGGGNKMPDPPKKAELVGKDKITVPTVKPPSLTPEPPKQDVPKPEAQLNIPAVTTSAGVQEMPGALTGLPSVPSQGSGAGGGAGTGSGTGIGPGQGSGLGPGFGGGTGGGAYRPGNGVNMPAILHEVKPSYTAEAMRAKIQGVVMVEAVVLPDGGVGQVQVVRSLDGTFGLDQEAIKAVKKWRFRPGTRFGQAVPVIVEIELTFTLR